MSPATASGGASALKGAGLIIRSAARACSRSHTDAMLFGLLVARWLGMRGRASIVGVLKGRLAAFVEGGDAFDAVRMDSRTPVRFHHDCDSLLDWLPLAHPNGSFDRLHRGRGVARDLLCYPVRHVHEL